MSDFTTLQGCVFNAANLANVRAIPPDTKWAASIPAVSALRDELMAFQNRRCAYCQGPIETEANGYRELEHILPKSSDGDQDKAYSTAFADRGATAGYKRFKFEPLNLVLICKQCNSSKGTFDPFKPRDTFYPIQYPNDTDFEWFHPHYHRYEQHIFRTPEWTFIHLTTQGDFTIRACKLDNPEQLSKRFLARAKANVMHSTSLRDALHLVCSSINAKYYGINQAASALNQKCNLPKEEAQALIELWMESMNSDNLDVIAKARGALANFSALWPAETTADAVEALQGVAAELMGGALKPPVEIVDGD